jgi:hypothetical protein
MNENETPALDTVDPFDPAQFAVTATSAAMATRKMLTHCRVGKPSKTAFVRASTRPEDTVEASILELKEDRETFLLMPGVATELQNLAKFVTLTVSVDRQGNPFLWVVNQVGNDGKDNDWNRSMREAFNAAGKRWVRVAANMASGGYDVHEAAVGVLDPVWPEYTMRDYIRVAFGEQNIIRDVTHPVVKRLLGLA